MSSFTILVVEDNLINQKLLMTILEKRGHTPTLAQNGAEAIECLSQQDFQIVLMDLQMPVLDGISATRMIRNGENGVRQKDIPVVALSALENCSDNTEIEDAGFTDWICKPYDIDDLMAKIAEILN